MFHHLRYQKLQFYFFNIAQKLLEHIECYLITYFKTQHIAENACGNVTILGHCMLNFFRVIRSNYASH